MQGARQERQDTTFTTP